VPSRRQRVRQVDDDEDHPGCRTAHGRHRRVRRPGHQRRPDGAADRAGARHRPGKPARLPAHDGAREPGDGGVPPPGSPERGGRPRARARSLPAPAGAPRPGRGDAVGWRAADARDGARPHGAAPASPHGRAVDGALAPAGPAQLRADPGDQSERRHDLRRGAERGDGPRDRPSRLRPPHRRDRDVGTCHRPAPEPGHPSGLPGRDVAGPAAPLRRRISRRSVRSVRTPIRLSPSRASGGRPAPARPGERRAP
jgi:hypothetical protein